MDDADGDRGRWFTNSTASCTSPFAGRQQAKVTTQMIITGALLPLIAPIALLHGFKRGKDAFIPAGNATLFMSKEALPWS